MELHRILTARELSDAILLVFANKQDLAGSMSVDEVRDRLQLDKFQRCCTVKPSCATSGEGLIEGLGWLAEHVKNPIKMDKNSNNPPLSPAPVNLAVVEPPTSGPDNNKSHRSATTISSDRSTILAKNHPKDQ